MITIEIVVSTFSVAVLTPQTYFQTLPSRAIPQEYETTAALWSLPMTIGSFITFALVANTHIDLFNAWRVHNALQEQFPVPWWRNLPRCGRKCLVDVLQRWRSPKLQWIKRWQEVDPKPPADVYNCGWKYGSILNSHH
jgi:hypothetical protein